MPANATLTISFMGYQSLDYPLEGRTAVQVSLTPEVMKLDDVIITGYQTLNRERATGSFGTITGKNMESKLQPNLSSALEGQVAGLTVDQFNRIEIRGVSTFAASSTPLIVIDGFPVDMSVDNNYYKYRTGTLENINPDNIENITVLKDGVAASIYGSRAANGVVVITTKTGQQGKPRVSYKGVFSITPKPNLDNLNRASASDYIDAEIDMFNLNPNNSIYNTNGTGILTKVSYLLKQMNLGLLPAAEGNAEINRLRNVSFLDQVEEHLYRPNISHQHNININGGSPFHTYNFSASYVGTQQDFVHTNDQRLTVDFKDNWNFGKYITFGANVNLAYATLESPVLNPNPQYTAGYSRSGYPNLFNFYNNAYFTPYTEIVDGNGNQANIWGISRYKVQTYEGMENMKSMEYYLLDDINKERVGTSDFQTRVSGNLKIKIMEGLSLDFGGNWQRGFYKYRKIQDKASFAVREAYNDATSKSNNTKRYLPEGDVVNENRNINQSWTMRSQLNFNRDFADTKHRVNVMLGNEIRQLTRDNVTLGTRVGYNDIAGTVVPVNVLDYNSTVYANDMLFGRRISLLTDQYNYMDNRFVSWYANGSYEFNNKYIITGSVRLDLTNFFGTDPDHRYKPLWSVGGTWKLSEESFFNVDFVNRLNLRASYGINGNIALDQGPFMILNTSPGYNPVSQDMAYTIASPPNDQLRWEKTQTANIGFDLSVLNNKLSLSFDYYNKYSTDLLASESVDVLTGFTSVTKNAGIISNKGIEIMLGANIIERDDFRWSANYNLSYNKSMVEEYNITRPYLTSWLNSATGGIDVAGYPANGLWVLKAAPLSATGNAMCYNKDGNIISTATAQPEDVIYAGTTKPKADMSFTNNFGYKNWNLSFMLVAKLGHSYYKDAFFSRNIANRHVGERWRQPGDEAHTMYPALSVTNSDWWYSGKMDTYVGDASYCKLRDITLSYTFDRKVTDKLKIADAKLYVQVRNLLTFKAKGTDIDPESIVYNHTSGMGTWTDWGMSTLPVPKMFILGLQVSL